MRHRATARFWACYHRLPDETRRLADCCHQLLERNPRHNSLQFKKIGDLWTARVGLHYRAAAVEDGADMVWVWIGTHADYDRLVKTRS